MENFRCWETTGKKFVWLLRHMERRCFSWNDRHGGCRNEAKMARSSARIYGKANRIPARSTQFGENNRIDCIQQCTWKNCVYVFFLFILFYSSIYLNSIILIFSICDLQLLHKFLAICITGWSIKAAMMNSAVSCLPMKWKPVSPNCSSNSTRKISFLLMDCLVESVIIFFLLWFWRFLDNSNIFFLF